MNRKAVLGIIVAVIIPLIGYIWLKKESDHATAMPGHFIPDSIITNIQNGKEKTDTVWHKIPDFTLTNQLGNKVSWNDMKGKIVVADFFYTHCPTICPTLTANMKMLQAGVKSNEETGNNQADFVQFLSFSIDPERDSVPQLRKWADRFQINPQNWWLLTGDKKTIYDLSIKDMKLPAEDGGLVDSNFVHTDVFVLIDKNRNIRGYYHTLNPDRTPDTLRLSQLSRDIILLSLEKDPKERSVFAGKLELIAIVFSVAAIGLILLFTFLKKEKA